MERLYCVNCLRQTPAYPCPLCGYDPGSAPAVGQALEQSILHGRYLTGRPLEKNSLEILYKGLDLAGSRPVVIHEFFPAGQAEREEDGTLRWTTPAPAEKNALLAQVRQRLPQERIADSFPENGTVYMVCQPDPPPPRQTLPIKKKDNEWLPFLLALLILILCAVTLGPMIWSII